MHKSHTPSSSVARNQHRKISRVYPFFNYYFGVSKRIFHLDRHHNWRWCTKHFITNTGAYLGTFQGRAEDRKLQIIWANKGGYPQEYFWKIELKMQHFQSIFVDISQMIDSQPRCTYLTYKLAITLSFLKRRQLNRTSVLIILKCCELKNK